VLEAAATRVGSLESRRTPPSPTVSGTAEDAYATTGRRWCIASSIVTPKPSWSEADTYASAASKWAAFSSSLTLPVNTMASSSWSAERNDSSAVR
jgi:hypothetical protein